MLTAKELRKTNIAEYILYMWQIEDLLRACNLDPEIIERLIVSRFEVDEAFRAEIYDWYVNLAMMMEKEYLREKGHLQVITNLVNDLNEFHLRMVETKADTAYLKLYQINLEAINDAIGKSSGTTHNEVEACFNALYGFIMMKLKSSGISELTHQTIGNFAKLLGHLSARYLQFENDEFEF